MTRRVILPDLFQLYKAARICHLHSFHDGIATACYTQRTLHLRRSSLRSQQGNATPHLLPECGKSRYVSVGFYPAYNYRPLIVFGGTRIQLLVLSAEYVNIVLDRPPGLVEAMCRNEHFVCGSKDKDFKMHSTKTYRTSRFTLNKHSISLKVAELRTLQYILHIITNQLYMYTDAFADVHAYVNSAMTSCDFIEPRLPASKSIIYRQLFDELKSPMY